MLNKFLASLTLLTVTTMSSAEVSPFVHMDFGFADTEYETDLYIGLGGGVQFNDFIELEAAYNNYGNVAPFDINVESYSVGLNIGGYVSNTVRLFGIIGSERLKVDETVRIGSVKIRVKESRTEAFYGVGVAIKLSENVHFRTKLIGHDSADLTTFSTGFAYLF